MPMMDFIKTRMGQEFFSGTVPRITKALERIADVLEKESLRGMVVDEELLKGPSATAPNNWARDDIQFARLLSEISAVDLDERQKIDLQQSMNLNEEQIDELFYRAEMTWQLAQNGTDLADRECLVCCQHFKKE